MGKTKTASGGPSTSERKPTSRNTKDQKRAPVRSKRAASAKGTSTSSRAHKTSQRPKITKKASFLERLRTSLVTFYRTVTDPEFWKQTAEKLPPWLDEVGAILLIVFGVVSLTALFNTTSEAMLSVTLSNTLRQVFGDASYFVCLGILGAGIIVLLPKFGFTIRFSWLRATAVEVTLGAFTALLHLYANDPQPRVLARDGAGGGYLGWALSELTGSLGRTLSLGIFSVLFIAGLIVSSGLRRYHLVTAINWLNVQIQTSIARLEALSFERQQPVLRVDAPLQADAITMPDILPETDKPVSQPYSRPSIVPRDDVQPDESPSQAQPVIAETTRQPDAPKKPRESSSSQHATGKTTIPARRLTKEERLELVEQTRKTLGAANGRSLVAPGEPGERASIVPRDFLPDARGVSSAPQARVRRKADDPIERYFAVDDFRETKKTGKRENSLPPLELLSDIELNKPTEEEINTNARIIKNTLLEFDVDVEVVDVNVGPTVTQYAVSPYTESVTEEGETVLHRVRVGEIARLSGDLALALSAKRLRIQAPVPGTSYVGVEVPNRQPSTVALRPVLETEHFYKNRKRPLALPLGRDVSGEPFIADLQTMPHLLIAGTTGSGKSIMLAAMTTAIVTNNTPDKVKLILLDPKMVELSRFNGLPHLLGPVETELDRIIEVLRWTTREMDLRYKLLEKEAARNLEIYNKSLGRRRKSEQLPYIVVIIDEIGDLMMQRPEETERALTRLAQMARAVGIHLMVATQRPSVDVITGLIKANFPARISFAVASGIDSRVILDATGAETLMGRGDMLFLAPDASGPQRVQGCYISDEEVNEIVTYWKQWHAEEIAENHSEPLRVAPWERGLTRREVLAETDPMLEDAIALVIAEGEASASMIQRRLGLGYPRAARLMDLMHELGVVGKAQPGGRTRQVLVRPGQDPFKKLVEQRLKKRN